MSAFGDVVVMIVGGAFALFVVLWAAVQIWNAVEEWRRSRN